MVVAAGIFAALHHSYLMKMTTGLNIVSVEGRSYHCALLGGKSKAITVESRTERVTKIPFIQSLIDRSSSI